MNAANALPCLRRFGVALAGLVVMAVASTGQAAAATNTLYVSPTGNDANACSQAHPCKTIGHTIAVAHPGDTVVIEKGTYGGGFVITKKLHLQGSGNPTLNAAGKQRGILLEGPGTAGSSITGLTVRNALEEGIAALDTSWLTIEHNYVAHNDLGMFASNPQDECAGAGPVPGDCGEGIHLATVSYSKVEWNSSTNNAGGFLMTDEFGPSHDNVVGWNHVWMNQYDCGITIPSHSSTAVSGGRPVPLKGGDYNNLITHNTVDRNGLKGDGAGILLAAAGPGGAAYNNTVSFNEASGNGMAGIVVHSHAPNQYLNGNRFLSNTLHHNNVEGDPDAGVNHPTDILVFSAVVPIMGTVANDNHLSTAFYGVWTHNAHTSLSGNTFSGVFMHEHQE